MSRFSQRSDFDTEPNALTRALAERRRLGLPVVDLTVSNPTQAGLPYEGERILAALAQQAALGYEPEPFGALPARERLALEWKARGLTVEPARIALTASTSEAYGLAFKLLCDPDDEVLVPAPSYPLLEHLARLENVRLARYALRYDGAWHVDFESLARAVTPRTRAIVSVSPNNPTGSFLSRSELSRLAGLGLPIVSDEVFAAYGWADDRERARSVLERSDVLVIALDGLSKLAALPQLKLAWMTFGGPDELVSAALSRLELVSDSYLSVGTPVQLALPELLASAESTRRAILARVRENRALLEEQLRDSAATALRAEGGWYSVVRLPRTLSEEEWVLGLLDQGVWVQPGYFYDFEEEAFVITSLLTPEADFREGVSTLANFVASRVA